ncbi:MAG: UDP-3-O-acyl-N-acetylglucosamine deacetylase [Holosporales bacterium]
MRELPIANNLHQQKTKFSTIDKVPFQATLLNSFKMAGIGVHSGKEITLTLEPSEVNTGIVFERTDVLENNKISALFDSVTSTTMCTQISNKFGVSVSTIEHLMAALSGCGVKNCLIKINGPEVPIMDGSARPFCDAILSIGVGFQPEKVKVLKIIKPIHVQNGSSYAELRPSDNRSFNMHFDFYGRMPKNLQKDHTLSFDLDNDSFHSLLAHARTFGFYEDAEKLIKNGLAKGASLKNTIIIQDQKVLNEEGLRSKNEFIEHKILDAIGDLALSNFHILGAYHAYNGSHAINNSLMRHLFKSIDSWYWIESLERH